MCGACALACAPQVRPYTSIPARVGRPSFRSFFRKLRMVHPRPRGQTPNTKRPARPEPRRARVLFDEVNDTLKRGDGVSGRLPHFGALLCGELVLPVGKVSQRPHVLPVA